MSRRGFARPRVLLAWTVSNGNDFVTCQVDRRSSGYAVTVVPHSHPRLATVETFNATIPALHRHRAVVTELRARGWYVVAYSHCRRLAPAPTRTAA